MIGVISKMSSDNGAGKTKRLVRSGFRALPNNGSEVENKVEFISFPFDLARSNLRPWKRRPDRIYSAGRIHLLNSTGEVAELRCIWLPVINIFLKWLWLASHRLCAGQQAAGNRRIRICGDEFFTK